MQPNSGTHVTPDGADPEAATRIVDGSFWHGIATGISRARRAFVLRRVDGHDLQEAARV